MDLNLLQHLPADFPGTSKVWIYQSSRLFMIGEALEIEEMMNEFVSGWKSHRTPVKGYANLFFGQFIILMADESATGVSGCSTDSSVHLIKAIEKKFSVDMFNRETLAFMVKNKIQLIPLSQFAYAAGNNFIDENTPYFNNTVGTKEQLLKEWIIPVKKSWLAGKMKLIN
ncbi:MAG TPA: hypothetical protein VK498_07395 [Ferruginibacter sp.]|nr:hypothetical protein [Ferruginibacter sp.]